MATMHHSSKRQGSTIGLSRLVGFRFAPATRPRAVSLRPMGLALKSAGPRRARRRAGAFCVPVDYVLPGTMLAMKQTSPNTAWAAEVATLLAWRDDVPYSIEGALAKVGPSWADAHKADASLSADETASLFAATGL